MAVNRRLVQIIGCFAAAVFIPPHLLAATGKVTIPYFSGRPGTQAFRGHPGWIDVHSAGGNKYSARIAEDATFTLPDEARGGTLIVSFDKFEVIPFVVPRYAENGSYDLPIPVEYACVPPGYPDVWDATYLQKNHHWFQVFVPECTQIYGITIFDGPKIIHWGNKFNATLHEEKADGKPIFIRNHDGNYNIPFMSGGHTDKDCPRVGWRHGDLVVTPGKPYAMCAGGYNSHGGQKFLLPTYIRPDSGDGAPGECFKDSTPTGGDLCCLIFGNGHGQNVENHIRTEEWEIFIPSMPPTRNWGQSFTSHGTSLAGIAFYANNGSDKPVTCEVKIRKQNAGGDVVVKATKVADNHDSTLKPIIRYTDWPRPVPGFEKHWQLPADLFQVSYAPDEIKLEPGKVYFLELAFSEPVTMYADGDYYDNGFAYYEDLKMERARQRSTKHSNCWTLLMNIVTYAHAGGRELTASQ